MPFQTCSLRVEAPGFAPDTRTIALRSNIPVALEVRLALAMHAESVQVTAFDEAPLVDPQATGTRAELNARAIERMPLATGTRGLESVLLSFPGFAADANGAIHPRGAHNQMQYVIDGMPVTDQLTGAFGTAIDASVVRDHRALHRQHPGRVRRESFRRGQHHHAFRHRLGARFAGSLATAAGGFDTFSERVQAGGGTRASATSARFTPSSRTASSTRSRSTTCTTAATPSAASRAWTGMPGRATRCASTS